MKFAFSTLATPAWEAQTVAASAKELGFDGIEIAEIPADLQNTRRAFEAAGVEIACLASSTAMPTGLRAFIDAAQSLGCHLVKILDILPRPSQSASAATIALARWLLPEADYAAERGVVLVIENALSFRKAREIWMMLESINHPAVAACWNVSHAAQAGESPAISVPTLNSRIQYARAGAAGLTPTLQNFLTRLRGIGYTGYVTMETPQDLQTLRAWTKPQPAKKLAATTK